MAERELPRLRLLMAPGTLPSQGKNRMDFLRYSRSGRPRLTGEELLAALPEIESIARVHVDEASPHDVATVGDLRRLALRAEGLLRLPDVDGLVLVQGTNSLEETAYFLNLTVHSTKPIAITGAQRPYTALSSDGPVNLLDTVRVASAPETHGKGVVVVTNGEINAARDVTKTNTYHVHAFRSRDLGLLGYADADKIVYYRAPTRRHTMDSEFDLAAVEHLPIVDILYIHAGSRRGQAEAAVRQGTKGLVVAGTGAGSTGNLAKELTGIAASGKAVVVQSSRVGEGRVVRHNNWYEPGMVVADNLSPHKSALLLALALTRSTDPEAIQRIFEQY
jgi:L-asparaginase